MASADEYAAWIVANQAKKGTPEFDIVAKAYQEAKGEPAVVKAGSAIRDIPRQLGLTVRHGMEGIGEVVNIGSEPIRVVMNRAAGAVGLPKITTSAKDLATAGADAMGLPTPQGPTERVVGDVTRMMAGSGGMGSTAAKVAENVASPVIKEVASKLAANQGTQAATMAGAGGAGGAVREAGGSPLEQFGGALVGGLSSAGLSALAVKAYNGIANAVGQFLAPKQSMQQINVTLNQILEQNGIDVSQVPGAVRAELAHEVKRALDTGRQLNPEVVRRIADYGVVGATPTRGTVTLDPVQLTQEKNLAKMGANTNDANLQELARIQNSNNAKLIENMNTLGANTANANPVVAGEAVVGHIRNLDKSAKATEKNLYNAARDAQGRAITLDSEGFVADAYNRLAASNKGAFLPDDIQKVLEQLRTGKMKMPDGREVQVPFTVDSIDNIKTMLATATRGAKDGNVRAALSEVRGALDDVQPRATGRPVGWNQVVDPAGLNAAQAQADDAATQAMKAFDEARKFARTRRTWQESSPGVAAALDDATQPDRFVREFIIGSSNKASSANVEALMHELHNNPAARTAVKENVVGYLKSKALSGAADEVGNFSPSAFNRALNEIGDRKLRLFFSPEEIGQLRAIGRVASYETVQPRGSAVNNANTAGALAGLLDKIANSSLVGKIPFGDAAVRVPARNWSAQIGSTHALDAGGAMVRPPSAPEVLRLEELFGPGLLLTAPRSNGRNNENRN